MAGIGRRKGKQGITISTGLLTVSWACCMSCPT